MRPPKTVKAARLAKGQRAALLPRRMSGADCTRKKEKIKTLLSLQAVLPKC